MNSTIFKTKELTNKCECFVCTGKIKKIKESELKLSKRDLFRQKRKEKKRKPKSYNFYVNKRHPRWLAVREKAIKKYGNKCMACGSTSNIHVHHATYERLYNEKIGDLRVLCASCHEYLHELHKNAGKPDLYTFTDDFIWHTFSMVNGLSTALI